MGGATLVIGLALMVSVWWAAAPAASAQAGPTPQCAGLDATIIGTTGDDVIQGTSGRDVIFAGPGDDVINGAQGDDIICGANGDDVIHGGTGFDWIVGGAGDDRILGNAGSDTLFGGPGDDLLAGGPHRDVLLGGEDRDVCFGGKANDRSDQCERTNGVTTLETRAFATLEIVLTERINALRTDRPSFIHPDDPPGASGPSTVPNAVPRLGTHADLVVVSELTALSLIEDDEAAAAPTDRLADMLGADGARTAFGQVVFAACGPHRRADLVNQLFFTALADASTFDAWSTGEFDSVGVAIVRGPTCFYAVSTLTGNRG